MQSIRRGRGNIDYNIYALIRVCVIFRIEGNSKVVLLFSHEASQNNTTDNNSDRISCFKTFSLLVCLSDAGTETLNLTSDPQEARVVL